jgi:hypothetical protein
MIMRPGDMLILREGSISRRRRASAKCLLGSSTSMKYQPEVCWIQPQDRHVTRYLIQRISQLRHPIHFFFPLPFTPSFPNDEIIPLITLCSV